MKKGQETQTKQKSNAAFILLVILLVAIIAVSSSIGLYAWARYTKRIPGETTGQVAKWNFSIRPGHTVTAEPRDFVMTRTDGYGNVAEDVLAPGTFGALPIFVDTTETEVLMKLILKIKVTDCPRNIKFYSDANRENELEFTQTEEDGKYVSEVEIEKYYSLNENASNYVDQVHDETIYWGWAYLTLDENNSATEGNRMDNEDSGKNAQVVITATGIQVLEEVSNSLAARVHVGDYVNYDPGDYSISPSDLDDLDGVSIDDVISTTSMASTIKVAQTTGLEGIRIGETEDNKMKWRVLNVLDSGEVQLVADRPTDVMVNLDGKYGIMNAIEGLNRVAEIYGHGKDANGARSIIIQDVCTDDYVSSRHGIGYLGKFGYGTFLKVTYSKGTDYWNVWEVQVDEEVAGYGVDVEVDYNGNELFKSKYYEIDEDKRDVLNEDFWYANFYCLAADGRLLYTLHSNCRSPYYVNDFIFDSDGYYSQMHGNAVMPVVTLGSSVETTGQKDGVWQLK